MLGGRRARHLDDHVGTAVNFGRRIDDICPAVAVGLVTEAGGHTGALFYVDCMTTTDERRHSGRGQADTRLQIAYLFGLSLIHI